MSTWFEPEYYREFTCKCGACRHTCCSGWLINVTEKEYFNMIGRECSEELHHRIECALVPRSPRTPETYMAIHPNWLGYCGMLDSDGLCMFQKECGEDAIPSVCRLYPRSLRAEGDYHTASLSGSCERVIELLLERDKVHFATVESDAVPGIISAPNKHSEENNKLCIETMQDRRMPVWERIEKICNAFGCTERVKPEDALSIVQRMGDLCHEIRDAALAPDIAENGVLLENLLVNHILYTMFPYTDNRITESESCIGLMVLYHLIRHLDKAEGDDLVDRLTAAFHLSEHTSFYYNCFVLCNKLKNGAL